MTEALVAEGLARELVHAIQTRRKEMNCQYTDRIEIGWQTRRPAACATPPSSSPTTSRAKRWPWSSEPRPLAGVEPVELKLGGAGGQALHSRGDHVSATPSIRRKLRLVVLISGGGTTLKNLLAKIEAGQLGRRGRAGHLQHPQSARAGDSPARPAFPRRSSHARRTSARERISTRRLRRMPRAHGADWVVMAGFLTHVLIPPDFENRVLNIHPGLIPAFCGQGFYGHHVHEAVLEYGAKISGCTVHFVDNEYDHGPIILQQVVPVLDDDTPDTWPRVFDAECEAYPEALNLLTRTAGLRLTAGG